MEAHYQFPSGQLVISISETPFCMRAEFKDANENWWKSMKYTAMAVSEWRLGSGTHTERVKTILRSIGEPPKIKVTMISIEVTISVGIKMHLIRERSVIGLDMIMEEDGYCEPVKSAARPHVLIHIGQKSQTNHREQE